MPDQSTDNDNALPQGGNAVGTAQGATSPTPKTTSAGRFRTDMADVHQPTAARIGVADISDNNDEPVFSEVKRHPQS